MSFEFGHYGYGHYNRYEKHRLQGQQQHHHHGCPKCEHQISKSTQAEYDKIVQQAGRETIINLITDLFGGILKGLFSSQKNNTQQQPAQDTNTQQQSEVKNKPQVQDTKVQQDNNNTVHHYTINRMGTTTSYLDGTNSQPPEAQMQVSKYALSPEDLEQWRKDVSQTTYDEVLQADQAVQTAYSNKDAGNNIEKNNTQINSNNSALKDTVSQINDSITKLQKAKNKNKSKDLLNNIKNEYNQAKAAYEQAKMLNNTNLQIYNNAQSALSQMEAKIQEIAQKYDELQYKKTQLPDDPQIESMLNQTAQILEKCKQQQNELKTAVAIAQQQYNASMASFETSEKLFNQATNFLNQANDLYKSKS